MPTSTKPVRILMAEDDEDDRLLVRDAWAASRIKNEIRFVEDGQQLLDYLRRVGRFAPPAEAPRPGLVLLDLNMPKKDGREALEEMKADPSLRNIPVVVMTNSKAEEDVLKSYGLGAAGFVVKPVTFESLQVIVETLGRYWFLVVELPPS